ncbi:hypothetical protein JI739_01985 [Ramlibacter sp. AW1]|uniref:Uncharacterized protein n=2 Tax=Ramlibacter aurantiacus TaxID=2801330 RepID=A0A937D3A2_9BURK|nr:hypothetical protein [Ramlibacter aurantiacus]MBL0419107.1 hypothetical protein [Ramlibacter aurantiacus]
MARVVHAIEQVAALPAWRAEALRAAPSIAAHSQGTRGVFFGYDFHAHGLHLGLIEINTNAGGALVNTLLARAQHACCPSIERLQPDADRAAAFEEQVVAMFRTEWRLARGEQPLRTTAIVDHEPEAQYLYPEFLLFQRLFEQHGIRALIADPSHLSMDGGALRCGGEVVDLVYNRLTDFYLEAPSSAALAQAWLQDAAVLTPHPQAHALFADKRRLVTLSDPAALERLGVPHEIREVLRGAIPRTWEVTPANADEMWSCRRDLFFKPFAGFGSRAAYRGDKLTRRVWQEIAAGGYIAQRLVPPGTRPTAAGPQAPMKFDLRQYAYQGQVQWTAARMYQGQTTNFRTPGGGFAPVYTVAPGTEGSCCAGPARDGHASFVFLLDDTGEVHPLPHPLYVALARGEATSPALAGQRFRAADWYLRMDGDQPGPLVNEWYGWVQFDADGRFDPTAGTVGPGGPAPENIDASAFPTAEERARMAQAISAKAQ